MYTNLNQGLISLLFVIILSFQAECQSGKYNVFNNPDGYIERLEFSGDGMRLKLTIDGIKYAKKSTGRKSISQTVLKLHNKMTNNTSEFKLNCISARIYYHAKAYSLKNPNWILNKSAREINAKYYELIWKQGCALPLDTLD